MDIVCIFLISLKSVEIDEIDYAAAMNYFTNKPYRPGPVYTIIEDEERSDGFVDTDAKYHGKQLLLFLLCKTIFWNVFLRVTLQTQQYISFPNFSFRTQSFRYLESCAENGGRRKFYFKMKFNLSLKSIFGKMPEKLNYHLVYRPFRCPTWYICIWVSKSTMSFTVTWACSDF